MRGLSHENPCGKTQGVLNLVMSQPQKLCLAKGVRKDSTVAADCTYYNLTTMRGNKQQALEEKVYVVFIASTCHPAVHVGTY